MKRYFLPLVLLLALLLRVVALSNFPIGFTPDEASYGYDAYSILKTGYDQWGHKLPLVLESFGDYKAPFYAYLTVPFIAIFGLTKFAVRLPNALISVLAVWATYLVVLAFIRKEKITITGIKDVNISLFAAFLLAISPWHIMMSRGAFEANLTTFLLPFAVYLFLKGLDMPKYLIFSGIIFGLNVFSYHSARFVTPLIFLFMIAVYKRNLFSKITIYHKLALIILMVVGMLTFYSIRSGALSRASEVSIFKLSLMEASTDRIRAINAGMNPIIARLIHNKYQAGLRHFFSSYLLYYSPQFYFSNGAGETTYGMFPGRGVLFWFEIPLAILFFVFAYKNIRNKFIQFIIFWIVIAPIPAALSIGPGYAANRAVIMLPAIQIALALGGVFLYRIIRDYFKKTYKYFVGIFVIFVSIFFFYFLEDYFLLSPTKAANGMLYGNLEVSYWLRDNTGSDNVIVSRSLSEPHIYIAFANSIDPNLYHTAVKNWDFKKLGLSWVDQIPEYSLDRYIFTSMDYLKFKELENTYLVGKPNEFPEIVKPYKIFYYPNGDPAIYVINTTKHIYAWKN